MVSNILHNRIYSQEHLKQQSLNKEEKYGDARNLRGFFADGATFVQSFIVSTANKYSLPIPIPMLATGMKVGTAAIGVLGAPLGLYIARKACGNGARALACGDKEGASLHALQGVMGLGSAASGGLAGADAIMDLAGVGTPTIVTGLFTGFGFGMYGALGLYGLYSRSVAKVFAKTLEKQEGPEQKIRWLYEQNSLSSAEIEKINRTAKDPNRVIARSLQKKWNAFDRRTTAECGKEIRGQLLSLVQNYNPIEAKRVIQVVEKANCKARVKSSVYILIALVGIVAFSALLLISGPAAPALFAAVALLSITLDSEKVQNYIAEKCWKWHLK
jgi:hypothetical protein